MGGGPVQLDVFRRGGLLDDGQLGPQIGLGFGGGSADLGVELEVALHQLGLDRAGQLVGNAVEDGAGGAA